jgi:hypothetical protein
MLRNTARELLKKPLEGLYTSVQAVVCLFSSRECVQAVRVLVEALVLPLEVGRVSACSGCEIDYRGH